MKVVLVNYKYAYDRAWRPLGRRMPSYSEMLKVFDLKSKNAVFKRVRAFPLWILLVSVMRFSIDSFSWMPYK